MVQILVPYVFERTAIAAAMVTVDAVVTEDFGAKGACDGSGA